MDRQVKRGDTGIYTAEGQTSGARAARLAREREKEKEAYAKQQEEIRAKQSRPRIENIDRKFDRQASAKASSSEATFKAKTYGLVNLAEFKKARLLAEGKDPFAANNQDKESNDANIRARKQLEKQKKKRARKRKMASTLSFGGDEDEDENENEKTQKKNCSNHKSSQENDRKNSTTKKVKTLALNGNGSTTTSSSSTSLSSLRSKKCPFVDTSFLPDRDREQKESEERTRLRKEWEDQQERTKREMLEITYSYWDGSGHRRTLHVEKACSIGRFLETVRTSLLDEFPELRGVSAENLIYVKEDLIIPQNLSFYDLIVTKARGKSGPLFHFDVHEDVRMVTDVRIEKDESHPGKVC